ncbi:cadherin-like domain-containing protein, partial [cf. Phormidesmis sp. LEGE 11477]|uniref:cadherin-like domain-containing protein n=1 Tax=cf. Phormidesmis sp. LEGE 11477 TaxID=1828680 RepID=UPI00187F649D
QDFQRLHFGLAQNQQVERIEVRWPSDVVQVIENVNVNQVLTITEQLSDGGIAPVAVGDTVTTVEDTAVTFNQTVLLSNDNLGDLPTTITAVDTVSANGGAIAINTNGTYTYTPAADFVGTDNFDYTITDGDGQSSSATVTVTVTPDSVNSELITDGLVLNLNADTGVSTDANGTVSSWADESGFGNDLTSAGDPILLANALNGRNAIEFDGVGDKLSRTLELNGLPAGNAARTVFLVAKYDGTGYGGAAYGDDEKNQTFGAVVDPSGNLMAQGWGRSNDFSSGELGTGTGWLLQGIVHDGTTVSQYRDGNLIGSRTHTYNTDVTNGEGLVIGAEIDSTPNINMDVATLLIYDRALSTGERQQVETYLQDQYFGTQAGQTPVAADDMVTTVEDTAVTFSETTLLSNDELGDIPTAVTAVDTVSINGGAITANSDSTYTYTPAADFVGTDSFDYTIADDDGQTSSATVTVTVTPESSDGLLTDGLVLNLNADEGVSTDSNSVVSSWADQTSLGNNLVSAGDPSLIVGALNGRNAIEFDGVEDKLSRTLELNGLPGGNAARTVFLVAKYDGTGYGGATYGDNAKNQTFGAVVDPSGNLMAQGWGGRNDFSSGDLGTGTGWLLQGIVHDGTTVSQYRDGNLIDSRAHTYNTDVTNGEGLVIGAEIDSSPHIDMDVATLLIYDRALSSNERQQVETYLQEKYFSDNQSGGGSGGNTGNPTDSADLLFSLRNGTNLNGVAVRSEDIVQYDGSSSFSLFFDGSDVGLGGRGMNMDAFTVISDNEILISFDKAMTLEGAGRIDDSDIVKFTATSLGEVTEGTFELYLDGSDVGLTKGEEDIDGLTGLSDGSLLISTQGPSKVPGVNASNEDLLLFSPTSLGENTSGSWSVYFDGSDVGLGNDSREYIDGLAMDASDKLLFSAAGNFDVPRLSGTDEDVFGFTTSSTGSATAGSFDTELLFDGSSFGLSTGNIDAISLAMAPL